MNSNFFNQSAIKNGPKDTQINGHQTHRELVPIGGKVSETRPKVY